MLCKQFQRLSFKKHRGYEIEKEAMLLAYQVNWTHWACSWTVQANSPSSSPSFFLSPSTPLSPPDQWEYCQWETPSGQVTSGVWMAALMAKVCFMEKSNHWRWWNLGYSSVKSILAFISVSLPLPYHHHTHTEWLNIALGWEWSGSKGGTSQILSPEIHTLCTGTWPVVRTLQMVYALWKNFTRLIYVHKNT